MATRFFLAAALLPLLFACGPRDITGTEETDNSSVQAAEQMRYPLFGSDRTQRMLYQFNTVNSMLLRQSAIEASLKNPDQTQKAPKERCPFLE